MDTVGFIQDLPTALIHSFRATLDEVKRADVLLHVRDASSTPQVSEAQRLAVEETLRELGASEVPTLVVWNKVDKEQDCEKGEEEVDDSSSNISCMGEDSSISGESSDGTMLPLTATNSAAIANVTSMKPRERRRRSAPDARRHDTGAAAADAADNGDDTIRVSAATGDGLKGLLGRVDALLHLRGNARLTPPPYERFRYVQTLPGQL